MKKIIFTLLLLTIMSACTSTDKKEESNTALIEKYVQAVENNDTATMESLMDDNYWGFGPSAGDSINKAGAITNWKNNIENLYESITYKKSKNISVNIQEGVNNGEWVSNWAELEIVYKKDKKIVTIWANTIYQIENNKKNEKYKIIIYDHNIIWCIKSVDSTRYI
jgi:hypothetical protein